MFKIIFSSSFFTALFSLNIFISMRMRDRERERERWKDVEVFMFGNLWKFDPKTDGSLLLIHSTQSAC